MQAVAQPTPAPATTQIRSGANPVEVLRGLRAQRSELREQLENLEDQRDDIRESINDPSTGPTDEKGLQARMVVIDGRIVDVEKAIAEADNAVALASAVPGAVVPDPPEPPRSGPPEEVWEFLMVLAFVFAVPYSIALARRVWRKGSQVVSAIPQEIYERFNRVDQAIDSVAVEVERIGEAQRYLTRVMAEQQKSLGVGAAEPVRQSERAGEQVRR